MSNVASSGKHAITTDSDPHHSANRPDGDRVVSRQLDVLAFMTDPNAFAVT